MKTYNFYERKDAKSEPTVLTVKEEDLTDHQLQLMMGELMNYYDKLPDVIKAQFAQRIVGEALSKSGLDLVPKKPR